MRDANLGYKVNWRLLMVFLRQGGCAIITSSKLAGYTGRPVFTLAQEMFVERNWRVAGRERQRVERHL